MRGRMSWPKSWRLSSSWSSSSSSRSSDVGLEDVVAHRREAHRPRRPAWAAGSATFSWKATMRPSASTSMTPKSLRLARGHRDGRDRRVGAARPGGRRASAGRPSCRRGRRRRCRRAPGFSSLMTCWHWQTASAEPRYHVLPVRCCAGMASMNWSRMGARRQSRAMCSSSDALLYCVSTLMRDEARVDEVRQDDVDDAVAAAERHGGLGAVERERVEALALAAREDHHEHLRRVEVQRPLVHARGGDGNAGHDVRA